MDVQPLSTVPAHVAQLPVFGGPHHGAMLRFRAGEPMPTIPPGYRLVSWTWELPCGALACLGVAWTSITIPAAAQLALTRMREQAVGFSLPIMEPSPALGIFGPMHGTVAASDAASWDAAGYAAPVAIVVSWVSSYLVIRARIHEQELGELPAPRAALDYAYLALMSSIRAAGGRSA